MGFFYNLSSGLGRFVDAVSEGAKKERDEQILKEAILGRLSLDEIKLLCLRNGITGPPGERYDPRTGKRRKCRLSKKDYAHHAAKTMGLRTIKDFASRHAKIHDLLQEERHMEEERTRWRERPGTDFAPAKNERQVASLVDAIQRFWPARAYREELFYQVELAGFLKHQFPEAAVEVQEGRARPDIVVGDVAVEIKGPTTYRDLATVFDKCVRYTARWERLIVVLFAVEVDGSQYAEWERSLKKHFPDVIVIRK